MSNDWEKTAWEYTGQAGNAKLLLLAIARHVGDDGSTTDLTIPNLMHQTGLKERGVQTLLCKLERAGELRREIGAGPHGRNRYTILLGHDSAALPSYGTVPEQQIAHQVQPAAPTLPASGSGASAESCTPIKERRSQGERANAPAHEFWEPVAIPPGEPPLPSDPLTLWNKGRSQALPIDEPQLRSIAAEMDGPTNGFGSYWLGCAILAASTCDPQFAHNPRALNLVRTIARRWQHEGSYGSDTQTYRSHQEHKYAQSQPSHGQQDVADRRPGGESVARRGRQPSTGRLPSIATACTIIGQTSGSE